ncbi:MAG: hypothetical protein IPI11_15335 [Haliscomenobacter sp.]|nr:hypothetical protein [Haliscomenobacter sp.]
MYFADLHCHPSGKNFPKYRTKKPKSFQSTLAHLWDIPRSKVINLMRGLRGTSYSQADVGSLVKSQTKLAYISIYPFEQGFIKNMGAWVEAPSVLVCASLRLSLPRIAHIRSDTYDYFQELQSEWEFVQRKSGQVCTGNVTVHPKGGINVHRATIPVEGRYVILAPNPEALAQNVPPWGKRTFIGPAAIDQTLEDPNCTLCVLTIEGMHALSVTNGDRHAPEVEESVLQQRIDLIKTWPVFFITFAHHFDNRLCAHARSFFKVPLPWNPNQTRNMNFIPLNPEDNPWKNPSPEKYSLEERKRGFSPAGFRAIQHLLAVRVNEDSSVEDEPALGRRIWIDTKHMSASSRLEFYDRIIRPYNRSGGRKEAANGMAPQGCIPVIASHSGYSGRQTLLDQIQDYFLENDENAPGNPFNPWNINLCDEDLEVICQSGGLIGLNLDQRILGIMYRLRLRHVLFPAAFMPKKERKMDSVELILSNILGMANGVKNRGIGLHAYRPDGFSFWNCICIGSDFDGGIDPINDYATVLHYEKLRTDLGERMRQHIQTGVFQEFGITEDNLEAVLDLFFFQNALQFLKRHFAGAAIA